MRILGKPLQNIRGEDLQNLLDKQVPESPTLEYKAALPEWNDAGKKELLANVSALANSSGGVLLFGVSKKRDEGHKTDVPEALVGLTAAMGMVEEQQRIERRILVMGCKNVSQQENKGAYLGCPPGERTITHLQERAQTDG